jgi:hypothetical protein
VTEFKKVESRKRGSDENCLAYAMVLKTNVEDLAIFRKWVKDALTALSATEVLSQMVSCGSIRVSEHCKSNGRRIITESGRSIGRADRRRL